MNMVLSAHFLERMKLRSIPNGLAEDVLLHADEYYEDVATGHLIAVKSVNFQGKNRDVAVAFLKGRDGLILITLHPLKKGQKKNRIKSKRWVKHEYSL